jgi:hypothetical protein
MSTIAWLSSALFFLLLGIALISDGWWAFVRRDPELNVRLVGAVLGAALMFVPGALLLMPEVVWPLPGAFAALLGVALAVTSWSNDEAIGLQLAGAGLLLAGLGGWLSIESLHTAGWVAGWVGMALQIGTTLMWSRRASQG